MSHKDRWINCQGIVIRMIRTDNWCN